MKKSTSYITRLIGAGTLGLFVGGAALMAGPQVPPAAQAQADSAVQGESPVFESMPEPVVDPAPAPDPATKPEPEPVFKPAPEPASVQQSAQPTAAPETAATEVSPPAEPPMPNDVTEQEALGIATKWLKKTQNFKANFSQVGPDGARSSGKIYLKQPGRVRFQYDAPSPLLIIADGVWITLADEEMGTVDRYPIAATPLQVLLGDPAKLKDDAVVNGLYQDQGQFELVLRSRENPGLGRMSLVFSKDNPSLQGWAVEDAQGLITQIWLQDAETDVALANSLFHISDAPKQRR